MAFFVRTALWMFEDDPTRERVGGINNLRFTSASEEYAERTSAAGAAAVEVQDLPFQSKLKSLRGVVRYHQEPICSPPHDHSSPPPQVASPMPLQDASIRLNRQPDLHEVLGQFSKEDILACLTALNK